jgi:hypothetical protein
MLILALLAAAQVAGPSDVTSFGDWAVACDNLRFCEAASLMADDNVENPPQIAIMREGGPAGVLAIEVAPDAEYRGGYRLEIDGRTALVGTLSGPSLVVVGGRADALAEAMLKGQMLVLRGGDGKPLSQASLRGITATLRYFDAQQGRVGTATALVAKGERPLSAVPAVPATPRIGFVLPSGKPAAIPAALRAAMGKQSQCDEVYADGVGGDKPETEAFALGGGKTLVLIPCGSGAYNYSTVPFVVEGGKAAVARFDRVPGSSEVGLATLVNAGWDAAKAELGTYAKGRGIGDCGASETFVWDGAMFRLIELRAMGECRGSTNFLRLWKAEAVPAR